MTTAVSFGWFRQLYDWVIAWGRTKYAPHILFFVAVIESSVFPIPPDVLLLVMGVAHHKRALWFAGIATVGSVIGGLIGYGIGMALFASIGQWIIDVFVLQDAFVIVGEQFKEHVFLTIAGAAFTPIPYKVFTIGAGFWNVPLGEFVVASTFGRGFRFFLEGFLLYYFGAKVAKFIEKYFGLVTAGVFVLVVLGFIAVKWFM